MTPPGRHLTLVSETPADSRPQMTLEGIHFDDIDLFAGAGGWSQALHHLGRQVLGIEWDPDACHTARAAGHQRLQADITQLDPLDFPCTGLIASAPCPTFSAAGKRAGRDDLAHVLACARDLACGHDTRATHREACKDERSLLSVEPLRWALALNPEWIALEQVPAVMPIWDLFAELLTARGYSCWAGILRAEEYGVPQTRKRAILMASRTRPVQPPVPTHQRYKHKQPQATAPGVLPWVSMAQALGWGATGRPYPTVACSSPTGGPDMEKVGGSGARAGLYAEQAAGRWHTPTDDVQLVQNARSNATVRDLDEPAPTITADHDHNERQWRVNTGRDWKTGGTREDAQSFDAAERPAPTVDGKGRWQVRTGNFTAVARDADGKRSAAGSVPYERDIDAPAPAVTGTTGRWQLRNNTSENAAVREAEPAPTMFFGDRLNKMQWEPTDQEQADREQADWPHERPAYTIVTGRKSKDGMLVGRQLPPGEGENVGGWGWQRPATTIAGDPRVFQPGGHHANDGRNSTPEQHGRSKNAIRVTIEEAGILQSFPADYPWHGTRSAQFRQVGNAIPPLLALAILEPLTAEPAARIAACASRT